MSFFPITNDDVTVYSLVTHPERTFVTSSSGATGSLTVSSRATEVLKNPNSTTSFVDTTYADDTLQSVLRSVGSTRNIFSGIDSYLSKVRRSALTPEQTFEIPILRSKQGIGFDETNTKKLFIKDILAHYYRPLGSNTNFAYTNYHTLNFFTSSAGNGGVLLYPNVPASGAVGYVSGSYNVSDNFTFDFRINPRYNQLDSSGHFKAGTIFHLSSSYAVSLVTGSYKDQNGKPLSYRIMLQLSHSADVSPSLATINGSYPSNLIFASDDAVIQHNNWHRVVIKWSSAINKGSGSFIIDDVECGTFSLPSSSIAPLSFPGRGQPDVLCVGNYYEGTNSGTSVQSYFFAKNPAERDGLYQMDPDPSAELPVSASFNHPLKAELHQLRIFNRFLLDRELKAYDPMTFIPSECIFYVPPFFTPDSPNRKSVAGFGGVLQTPFFEVDGTTRDPFNVSLALGVDGHYINLENFVRNFALPNAYPRLLYLSASAIATTTTALSANEFLGRSPEVNHRNLFILPCDDGKYKPSLDILEDLTTNYSRFVDDLGNTRFDLIGLQQLVVTSSYVIGGTNTDGVKSTSTDISQVIIGPTPEQPAVALGKGYTLTGPLYNATPLTIFERSRDPSSNRISWFEVSNIFYGKRLQPKSITLTDTNMSGSDGAVRITLKDDGFGNLYRADSVTPHATWNVVGNAYYDEGILFIKSPHIYNIGKLGYTLNFKGVQSVHVLTMDTLAPASLVTSSSNPSWRPLSGSLNVNDSNEKYVLISGINFHDDNFNVVARTTLAQPILKKAGDRFLFRSKLDF